MGCPHLSCVSSHVVLYHVLPVPSRSQLLLELNVTFAGRPPLRHLAPWAGSQELPVATSSHVVSSAAATEPAAPSRHGCHRWPVARLWQRLAPLEASVGTLVPFSSLHLASTKGIHVMLPAKRGDPA